MKAQRCGSTGYLIGGPAVRVSRVLHWRPSARAECSNGGSVGQVYNRVPYWSSSASGLSRLSQSASKRLWVTQVSLACQAAGLARRGVLDLSVQANGTGLRQDALLEAWWCRPITGCPTGGSVLQTYNRMPYWRPSGAELEQSAPMEARWGKPMTGCFTGGPALPSYPGSHKAPARAAR